MATTDTEQLQDALLQDAPAVDDSQKASPAHGGEEDANSEAETLIDSPVKKREAERQAAAAVMKPEKATRSHIGGLPVPNGDDDEMSPAASPMLSTETSEMKVGSVRLAKDDDVDVDIGSDKENSSGSLSSISNSHSHSRSSSRSRALSERPELSRNGADSPNPRKRKHRASSVTLPNKRQSMEPPKRRLRGMHSEDVAAGHERSLSPDLRSHRRAISTQSAFMDGTGEGGARKRRSVTQFPVRDAKASKSAWEESDASSETTSHGQIEQRRPQRGIGRSTSTPGRPVGREHKRHINKYGFTRLAEACEAADMDLVKEWREKDPEQLELAEYAGNKPLQIAALNGNGEVVKYLIEQGCKIDCANVDKDTPLIDASENGHLDVVRILLEAGVDPIRQNLKGQQAMDVVDDTTEDADAIRAALREAIEAWNSSDAKQRREEEDFNRHRAGPTKELHFMARTYENLLKLVTINDRNGVREFLDARVPVDNAIIAAAARTGDWYLVNMLLAEMTDKKAHQKAEKPMLAVLGSSHWEMVKNLTELEQFNPLYRNRAGKSWPEIAEERNGPNSRQEIELLRRLHAGQAQNLDSRDSNTMNKREHAGEPRKSARAPDDDEDEEDSDEEAAPKRKNGRRLLSRRDMRVASGRSAMSDDESEEGSTSDNATEAGPVEIERVRPPAAIGGPGSQKGAQGSRPRTKSFSNQPSAVETASSPRTRRRSSSLRGMSDKQQPSESALPTVEEKAEEKAEVEMADVTSFEDRGAKAMFAIEEAQRLEAKRREADDAEAEVRRVQAEVERAETERKVEEERVAEAARKAEAEAEAAQRAEDDRIVEEERQQREAERMRRKNAHQEVMLSALPRALAQVLDPDSDFRFEGLQDLSYLLEHFTPFLVLKRPEDDSLWMTNLQVSALLGKCGLQCFLHESSPGFEDVERPFDMDDTLDSDDSKALLSRMTKELVVQMPVPEDEPYLRTEDVDMNDADDFHAELSAAARRRLIIAQDLQALQDGTVPLYWIKLQWVLNNLHPLLRGAQIPLRYVSSQMSRGPERHITAASVIDQFMEHWIESPLFSAYGHGQIQPAYRMDEVTGFTDVSVVRPK